MEAKASQIKKGLGNVELFTFTYCSTITIGFIFLPYVSSEEIRSAWLKVMFAVIPYFVFLYLMKKVIDKHGNRDILQTYKEMTYKWVYYVTVCYLLISTLYSCFFGTKSLVIIVQTYLMQDTSQNTILLAYLIVVGVSVMYGITAISRMLVAMFIHEVILIISLGVFFFSDEFKWINVPPIFGVDILTFIESSLSEVTRYGGIIALLLFLPHVKKEVKIFRTTTASLSLIMITYVMISMLVLGVFGFDQAITLLSPITALMQTTTSPSGLFERLDLFFLTVWIMSFFKIALIYIWFATSLLKRLLPFQVKREWVLVVIITSIVIVISMATPSITYIAWRPYNINNLLYTLTIPILLFSYLLLRKKRKNQGNQINENS